MRKIVLVLLAFTLTLIGHSQIRKGAHFAGAQLAALSGTYTSSTQEQKSRNLNISTYLGKAIKENKVAGILIGITSNKATTNNNSQVVSTNTFRVLELGVFLRQYKKLAKDFYFYGQGDLAYRRSKQQDNFSTPNSDNSIIAKGAYFSVGAGIAYQVFRNFYFEVGLPNMMFVQYIKTNQRVGGVVVSDYSQKEFSFRSSLFSNNGLSTFGVGFRIIW